MRHGFRPKVCKTMPRALHDAMQRTMIDKMNRAIRKKCWSPEHQAAIVGAIDWQALGIFAGVPLAVSSFVRSLANQDGVD